MLHTVGRQAKDLGLEKNYNNKKVIFCCHSPDLQLITCFSQGIESAPEQPFNSVCQTECPTPKSQCNADNAYSKARGYRGGCALRKGKEQSEMRTQTGTGSTAFYQPYRRRLLVPTGSSTKLVHGMITEMKGKHTGRMVNGWLGYETFFFFFPGFGWRWEWHSSLSAVSHCSPRSTASCRATLCYGTLRGTAANSSSTLQISLLLRFAQVEPDCVSKPLRVQHVSKIRKIILNTARAGKNSETQIKPVAWSLFHCRKQRQRCYPHQACRAPVTPWL